MLRPMKFLQAVAMCGAAVLAGRASGQTAAEYVLSKPATDANGIITYTIRSKYQGDSNDTLLRILPPRKHDANTRRILFVLPVEAGVGSFWGDALDEIRRLDLHNKYNFVAVYPTFAQLPWYADHPADANIRQESHFIRAVVPAVDSLYPAPPAKKALLGFSKSGYGAVSLLLRHLDLFAAAAAWDAPLMEEKPNKYGMAGIFGTQDNFLQYRVTDLLKQQADTLKKTGPRLAISGYGNFRVQMQQCHELMNSLGIEHLYSDGPQVKHHWNTGWAAWSVESLDKMISGLSR